MQNPILSAIIIAKNEEKNIERCLKSIKNIAEEIIIADTGSSDKTKKIASKFTKNIYDFEWKQDFSEARNFAISKAKGKILLSIDADEAISKKDASKFEEIKKLNTNKIWGIKLPIRLYLTEYHEYNYHPCKGEYEEFERGYKGYVEIERILIFPKNEKIYYQNAIHETVEKSILSEKGEILRANIPIHNFGYKKRPAEEKEKQYEEILLKELKKNPEDYRAQFNYGYFLYGKKEFKKAIPYLQKAYKLIGEKKGMIAYYYAICLFLSGEAKKSEKIFQKLIPLKQPAIHYYLSRIAFIKGDISKSLEIARKAVRIYKDNYMLLKNLQEIYQKLGNEKLALYYKNKAEKAKG